VPIFVQSIAQFSQCLEKSSFPRKSHRTRSFSSKVVSATRTKSMLICVNFIASKIFQADLNSKSHFQYQFNQSSALFIPLLKQKFEICFQWFTRDEHQPSDHSFWSRHHRVDRAWKVIKKNQYGILEDKFDGQMPLGCFEMEQWWSGEWRWQLSSHGRSKELVFSRDLPFASLDVMKTTKANSANPKWRCQLGRCQPYLCSISKICWVSRRFRR
jgi:hypothetical protein